MQELQIRMEKSTSVHAGTADTNGNNKKRRSQSFRGCGAYYEIDKETRNIYENHREKLWGRFGPYDAFSIKDGWYDDSYLAIDQLVIVPMIENYRSGLFWKIFMDIPEVRQGLGRMGVEPVSPVNGFPHVVVPVGRDHAPDAVDLRRHPDSGLYRLPYMLAEAGHAVFTLVSSSGRELLRREYDCEAGDHVLEFLPFAKPSSEILRVVMRLGDELVAEVPVRLN